MIVVGLSFLLGSCGQTKQDFLKEQANKYKDNLKIGMVLEKEKLEPLVVYLHRAKPNYTTYLVDYNYYITVDSKMIVTSIWVDN